MGYLGATLVLPSLVSVAIVSAYNAQVVPVWYVGVGASVVLAFLVGAGLNPTEDSND